MWVNCFKNFKVSEVKCLTKTFIRVTKIMFLADFLSKLQNVPCVSKKAFLVTLDVTSLYSNIPHKDGIKACEHFLNLKPSSSGIST